MATTKTAPKPAEDEPVTPRGPDLFREALDRVLVHEGGKVDDPRDPGGRTNMGITQRVYNGWRAKQNLGPRDVYQISEREVEAIYRFQYWEPISGSLLPRGVGYVVMDGAVNSGVKQSVKWLQRALANPEVKVDGVLGVVTLPAVKANTDHDRLIADICRRRLVFLQALKTWPTFKGGWKKRVAGVLAAGQAWAMGSVGPEAEFAEGGNRKASIDDAKSAPPKAPGDLGIAGGGGTAMTSQAIEQLSPYESFGWIKQAIIVLTILGIVVAGLAALYRGYAKRKADELSDALDTEVAN